MNFSNAQRAEVLTQALPHIKKLQGKLELCNNRHGNYYMFSDTGFFVIKKNIVVYSNNRDLLEEAMGFACSGLYNMNELAAMNAPLKEPLRNHADGRYIAALSKEGAAQTYLSAVSPYLTADEYAVLNFGITNNELELSVSVPMTLDGGDASETPAKLLSDNAEITDAVGGGGRDYLAVCGYNEVAFLIEKIAGDDKEAVFGYRRVIVVLVNLAEKTESLLALGAYLRADDASFTGGRDLVHRKAVYLVYRADGADRRAEAAAREGKINLAVLIDDVRHIDRDGLMSHLVGEDHTVYQDVVKVAVFPEGEGEGAVFKYGIDRGQLDHSARHNIKELARAAEGYAKSLGGRNIRAVGAPEKAR